MINALSCVDNFEKLCLDLTWGRGWNFCCTRFSCILAAPPPSQSLLCLRTRTQCSCKCYRKLNKPQSDPLIRTLISTWFSQNLAWGVCSILPSCLVKADSECAEYEGILRSTVWTFEAYISNGSVKYSLQNLGTWTVATYNSSVS